MVAGATGLLELRQQPRARAFEGLDDTRQQLVIAVRIELAQPLERAGVQDRIGRGLGPGRTAGGGVSSDEAAVG